MKIQLTPSVKICLIGLQVIILLLLPVWCLKVFHYFFMPMPSVFASPSMIPTEKAPEFKNWNQVNIYQTFINMSTFLLFWIQHIIMASYKFKIFMKSIWPTYLFYERLIYNIFSSLLLIFVLDVQIPQNYVLFTLPWAVCIPLAVAGFFLFGNANLQFKENLFAPYPFKMLMQAKQLEKTQVQQVQKSGIFITGSYKWVRHPMQSGLFILLCFGNAIFTFQKCVMLVVLFTCVVIGVMFQQKRLLQKYTQYADYMKQIRVRFIPYVI